MDGLPEQGVSVDTHLRIGAVLLAAGEGSRMGSMPKCLLSLAGVPLIHRYLMAMSDAGIDEVVVVTGHHFQPIESALETFPVTLVRNPHPERGQQSSVSLGLHALGTTFDLVLVALADQPLIGNTELTELINAFKKRAPGTDIVYPEVESQRGNPVLFTGAVVAEILAGEAAVACRQFIDTNPQRVHVHVTENDRFILDLDTPEDIAAFEQRTGSKLAFPPMPASAPSGNT